MKTFFKHRQCVVAWTGIVMLLLCASCSSPEATETPFPPTVTPNDAQRAMTATAQAIVDLCSATTPGSLSVTSGKILVLKHSYDEQVLKEPLQAEDVETTYQQSLNANQRAGSIETATALVCIEEKHTVVESCDYGPADGGGAERTILRVRVDEQLSLIDIPTHGRVADTTFVGGAPGECPSSIKESDSTYPIYGDSPSAKQFVTWFNALSR